MPKKWVMDKNYEWEEIEVVDTPIVRSKPTTKSKRKPDYQFLHPDYCPCGRKPGERDRIRWGRFCSRYCHIFHTQPAPGYKRKTLYSCWRGTGSFALNPKHPSIIAECEWCCADMWMGYGQSYSRSNRVDATGKSRVHNNARFCNDTCRLEATQCARKQKMQGTARYNKIFEIISYLRLNGPSTAHQISSVVRIIQQYTFSPRTVSSLVRPLVSKGFIKSENKGDDSLPNIYSLPDPTISPKEILVAMGANLK